MPPFTKPPSGQPGPRRARHARRCFLAAALTVAACSYDWDALDPREGSGANAGGSLDTAGAAGSAGGQVSAGRAGAAGEAGATSSLECPTGEEMCGDECVVTASSLDHCGYCSHACQRYATCAEGTCQNPCDATGMDALLVVADATTMGAGDQVVAHLIEALGFTVLAVSDDATAADADGMDLVLISSTVDSTVTGTAFTDIDVPVICWDAHLYGNLGLTGDVVETDFGTLMDQRYIELDDASHPLAVGLSGSIRVFNQGSDVAWGSPTDAAIVFATADAGPDRAVWFAVDAGAPLSDGTPAPARRMGLLLGDTSAPALSQDGERFVLASFCWAVGALP